jgi:hypothetical protein
LQSWIAELVAELVAALVVDLLVRVLGAAGCAPDDLPQPFPVWRSFLAGSCRLDAAWMTAFSAYHVHNTFGIEAKVEEQLQPGISISRPVSGCQDHQLFQGKDLQLANALVGVLVSQ